MQFLNGIQVAVAIIQKGDRFLVNSRPEGREKAGYWEFPGGKVESGETVAQAVVREVVEELGILVASERQILQKCFTWLEKRERPVTLNFHLCRHVVGDPQSLEGQEFAWKTVREIQALRFLPTNQEVIELLSELVE